MAEVNVRVIKYFIRRGLHELGLGRCKYNCLPSWTRIENLKKYKRGFLKKELTYDSGREVHLPHDIEWLNGVIVHIVLPLAELVSN